MHWIVTASQTKQESGTSNFQLWGVPIIVGIIFYAMGAVTAVYIKRPRLAVIGGGSGGSGTPTGFHSNNITVINALGRLGISIGQNVLFGLRLNKSHWFGLPVMRDPATGCTANLYDEQGNHVAPLWWRDPNDNNKRKLVIDLDSGQRADLLLFAQRNDDVPNYYTYEPDNDGSPIIPATKFIGRMKFAIRITYSEGQKVQNFKYTAFTDLRSGRINLSPKWRKSLGFFG